MEKASVKERIAKNLVELRKANKMTQQALAEKINYSDKAVSRWEHAETLPDIDTLVKICELYGVKFEYLLKEEGDKDLGELRAETRRTYPKIVIPLIAISTVWLIALLFFTCAKMIWQTSLWTAFIWAIPVSFTLALIFASVFGGGRALKHLFASGINWTLILSLYLEALNAGHSLWMLFIIGAPIQAILQLSLSLKPARRK